LEQEQSARQQAEKANRAKDEFLANLSHELRNPLTPILAWSQMLRSGKLKEAETNRALEVIERSARAQAQLIEDLLDISRITNGKLKLTTRSIDLRLVVQAALEGIQLSASAKNIEIVSHLSSVKVLADIDRLQQVLWNILSNAIKFTMQTIENHGEVRVTDTGKGIAPELLPHIFDRFRQGDSSSTKADQGLGLGLAIVYHLVQLHGGTVQADSPGKGQGTTITVRLPLKASPQEFTPPSPEEPAAEPESAAEAMDCRIPSLNGLQILVVDDEADTRDLLKFVLEKYGAEVLTAASAREAMAALRENLTKTGIS
jgi:two-component system CheB/CheR fusion protein